MLDLVMPTFYCVTLSSCLLPLRPQSSHLEHGQPCGSSRELPLPVSPLLWQGLPLLKASLSLNVADSGFTQWWRPGCLPEGTKLIKPSRSHLLRGERWYIQYQPKVGAK